MHLGSFGNCVQPQWLAREFDTWKSEQLDGQV